VVEARHGPALSERERQELTSIEQALREDRSLDEELRTMRRRGLHWLRRGKRRSGGSGQDRGAGA
jgi:hypothetical protein